MKSHKSKGIEFHTTIFFGLDSDTWWSLKPSKPEELNAFFVALTRARHRAFFMLSTGPGAPVFWIECFLTPAGAVRVDGVLATGRPRENETNI